MMKLKCFECRYELKKAEQHCPICNPKRKKNNNLKEINDIINKAMFEVTNG